MSFLSRFRPTAFSSRMGNSQSQESNTHPNPHHAGDGSEDDLWIGSPAHRAAPSNGRDAIDLVSSSAPVLNTSQTLSAVQETPVKAQDEEADDLWVSPHKSLDNTLSWSLGKVLSGRKAKSGTARDQEDEVWQSFVDARSTGKAEDDDCASGVPMDIDVEDDEQIVAVQPANRLKRGRASDQTQRSAGRDSTPTPQARQQNKRRKIGEEAVFAVPALPSTLDNGTTLPTPPVSEPPALVRSRKRKMKESLRLPETEDTAERNSISNPGDSLFILEDEHETQSDVQSRADVSQNDFIQAKVKSPDSSSISGRISQDIRDTMEGQQEDLRTSGPFTNYETMLMDCFMDDYCRENDIGRESLNNMIQDKQRGESGQQLLWEDIYELLPQRPKTSIRKFCRRRFHNYAKRGKWSAEDDKQLEEAYELHPNKWTEVGEMVGRMPEDCRDRWRNYLQSGNREKKGEWSTREELDLSYAVSEVVDQIKQEAGEMAVQSGSPFPDRTQREWEKMVNWSIVSQKLGNNRSRIQCLQHWQTMERRESSLSRTSLSRPNTPGRLSTAPPSSTNWRHKAAERTYDKMLVGDKIQILLQIQACEAISEGNIPWAKLTENGDPKWTTMDRRLAFDNMKTLLTPKQLRKPLREVVSDLIDYFEMEHTAELNDFYVSPSSKVPSGSKRRKRNGRYMAYDADEGEDDSLDPEDLSPRTKRRRRQKAQSSDLLHVSTDESDSGVKDVEDNNTSAQSQTGLIAMSEEIVSVDSEPADAKQETDEGSLPPIDEAEGQVNVIEETEEEDDESNEDVSSDGIRSNEHQQSDNIGRAANADASSPRSSPDQEQSSDGDEPQPARFVSSPIASDTSDEKESIATRDTSEGDDRKDSESEGASRSVTGESAANEAQSESETGSEAEVLEDGRKNEASSEIDDLDTSITHPAPEAASSESASGSGSEDADSQSDTKSESSSESGSRSDSESTGGQPSAKAEQTAGSESGSVSGSESGSESGSKSGSESGSESGTSSEDSTESAEGVAPAANAKPTQSLNLDEAPQLLAGARPSEDSDSDLASNWPYDSPHKPNDVEALQKADEEALANFEKGFSWTHIHDVWESRTQQGLSPNSFGERLDALRDRMAPKPEGRKRATAPPKTATKATSAKNSAPADDTEEDEENEDSEDEDDPHQAISKGPASSTSSQSSGSNETSESDDSEQESDRAGDDSDSQSGSGGGGDHSSEVSDSSSGASSPAVSRGAMSSGGQSEYEDSSD